MFLMAEDCDDSFPLSELPLEDEHVWRPRGEEALRIVQSQRTWCCGCPHAGMDGYQRPHNGEWIALTQRCDRGLVVSGVPDAGFALTALTPNQ